MIGQYIGVTIAVFLAVAWIIRKIVRRRRCARGGAGCNCGGSDPCAGCDLAGHCRSRR